jgi:cytochrome c biogenesis protein CcmG, thiol:disulfide interchange protein DsbE
MRRGRVLGWAVVVILLVVLLVVGLSGKAGGNHAHLAPTLPREDLVAPAVTLAALHGEPTFLTFWASWCGPCAQEATALERFSHEIAGRAHLVGVNWRDERSDARSFISRHRWTFPSLRDGPGTVGEAYGITGLPTTYVLDARGQVKETLRGPQTTQTLAGALARVSD